ncbi:hypothetical protein BSKO_06747 [Bryopsis sp. KO-2023]|nr:hypothetical protein BSKO_06747 [Bryopsis sp. KO-2023]
MNETQVHGKTYDGMTREMPGCFPALRLAKSLGRRLKRVFRKATPHPPRSDAATAGSEISCCSFNNNMVQGGIPTWPSGVYLPPQYKIYQTHDWSLRALPSIKRSPMRGCMGYPVASVSPPSPPPRSHQTATAKFPLPETRKKPEEKPGPSTLRGEKPVQVSRSQVEVGLSKSVANATGSQAPKSWSIKSVPGSTKERAKPGDIGSSIPSAKHPSPPPESATSDSPKPNSDPSPFGATEKIQVPKPNPSAPVPFHSSPKPPISAPRPISKGVTVKKLPPPLPRASLLQRKRISRQPQVAELFREFVVGVPEILSSTPSQKSKDLNPKKSGLGVIGEMASKSPYFLGIAKDVQTYRNMIEDLIATIRQFQPKDMDQVVSFGDFVDGRLAPLTDEAKVLDAFDWPPRYNHIREAAGVHRQLLEVEEGFLHWVRCRLTVEDELLAMEKHLGAMIEKLDLLLKDQEAMEKRFKDAALPWHTSVWVKTKQASLQLFLAYASLAIPEVATSSSKKRSQSLLKRIVEFAYKVHTLAAGFCPQCVTKFEEIRALVAAARAGD